LSESAPVRNYSLLRQFLVPILLCVLATGVLVASVSKWAADRDSLRASRERLRSTGNLLSAAPFPLTPSVLQQLHELTGLDFAIFPMASNGQRKNDRLPTQLIETPLQSTLVLSPSEITSLEGLQVDDDSSDLRTIVLSKQSMRCLALRHGETILVLLEKESTRNDGWLAFVLPIVTGMLSSLAIGIIATWIAARFARRIDHLKVEVGAIAQGDFSKRPLIGPADDIQSLQKAIHEMSFQLDASQKQIAHNERARLIHLLASGLAHELRNHLTGARLALQTCDDSATDAEAISIAMRQLDLAEGQIRRLLAVRANQATSATSPMSPQQITRSVIDLVRPMATHRQIQLDVFSSCLGDSATSGTLSTSIQPDGEAIVGVLVNLVMNAMEAVDVRGKVEFDCSMRTTEDASIPRNSVVWSIRDNGPGPDEQIRDSMFEPFVTTKLEGVGLGLSMCKRVAVALGGELRWERKEGWTVFEFSVPEQESSS
jgi:signal transduction histidine kinase